MHHCHLIFFMFCIQLWKRAKINKDKEIHYKHGKYPWMAGKLTIHHFFSLTESPPCFFLKLHLSPHREGALVAKIFKLRERDELDLFWNNFDTKREISVLKGRERDRGRERKWKDFMEKWFIIAWTNVLSLWITLLIFIFLNPKY